MGMLEPLEVLALGTFLQAVVIAPCLIELELTNHLVIVIFNAIRRHSLQPPHHPLLPLTIQILPSTLGIPSSPISILLVRGRDDTGIYAYS